MPTRSGHLRNRFAWRTYSASLRSFGWTAFVGTDPVSVRELSVVHGPPAPIFCGATTGPHKCRQKTIPVVPGVFAFSVFLN